MKKVLLFPMIALTLFGGCKQHEQTDTSTAPTPPKFVTFIIDSSATNKGKIPVIDLYYSDLLGYGHPVFIGGKGTKLILDNPTLFFEATSKQVPFLVYPGETIHIKYIGMGSSEMYIKDNAQRTNELDFFRELVKYKDNIYGGFKVMPYQRHVNTMGAVKSNENEIFSVKKDRLAFLDTYVKQHPVSSDFFKIATSSIQSVAVTDTLLLYFYNQKMLADAKIYPQLMAEKRESFKQIKPVPYQLYFYPCGILASLSLTKEFYYIAGTTDSMKRMFTYVQNNFIGYQRDYLLAHALFQAYNSGITVPADYIHIFNAICTNATYKDLITKKLKEKEAIVYPKGSNNLLATDGKTVQGMQAAIAKYKGKLVLLDFWASWCAPCREEIPYTEKLRELYKGKNIVFVPVSTDQNTDDWVKANQELLLPKEDNFLLLNSGSSTFMKQNNINDIPRFILIGKDGQIIKADAPRPSEPKLKELIDKYL